MRKIVPSGCPQTTLKAHHDGMPSLEGAAHDDRLVRDKVEHSVHLGEVGMAGQVEVTW